MSFATEISNATAMDAVDTVLIEKVRWSLRQRLRKQMQVLCSDFFDETDDFLFGSGQKGQFADDSIYLNAMRELRTRQTHFEDRFLDSVIKHIKHSYLPAGRARHQADFSLERSTGIESIEIDLALKSMRRKADKTYLGLTRQVEDAQRAMRTTMQAELIGSSVILDAVCEAFAWNHSLFKLPLEIRLVVIKLFEQHFVLRMEKYFLDIISIVNNVSDPNFVDKLYSSSSAFRSYANQKSKTVFQSAPVKQLTAQHAAKPGNVESAVGQLMASIMEHKQLPEFVTQMLETKWRNVMFLIGLNKGCTSIEWSEARHAANMLATVVDGVIDLLEVDSASLQSQLQQGFALIQMPTVEQQAFFAELESYLGSQSKPQPGVKLSQGVGVSRRRLDNSMEALVSPSGESILDQDDLDEIAKMLGDDKGPGSQRELSDYLVDVDALKSREVVDFMLNGAYVQCLLRRTDDEQAMYTISKQGSKISITRTRLGLALALQSGELRRKSEKPMHDSDSRTIMEPASRTRH